MTVRFDDPGPPAGAEDIDAVERRLGTTFPVHYRSFLQTQNGGDPEPNFFDEDVGVRQFLSAGPIAIEGVRDLETVARLYSPDGEADYVPPSSMLAIGEDDLGNLICIAVGGEDAGAVFFWDHEAYEDEHSLRRLADDFGEFFHRLRPEAEMVSL